MLRTIDDLVDENDPRASARVDAVDEWAHGHGAADTPETQTLTILAEHYPIPRVALSEFCEGMRHDITGQGIETEHDFKLYCHQVGGTVGVMLTALLGSSHPDCEHYMERLGRAMQWTNILRDIDEDKDNGRTYLAQSTIDRFGPPIPGSREALLRDQISRADKLYGQGMTAIPLLEHGRLAMHLSTVLYQEILRQIERDGYGKTAGRAKVPESRKRLLIATHTLRKSRSTTPALRPV
jgi:phytoene synthase